MSFVGPPFEHDLFVSYSHGDVDGTGQSNLKTWSQAFARELEAELRQHPKFRELRIFFDQHFCPDQGVDPLAPLTQQLRDDIGASGLLLLLMSPHYLLSKWCSDERNWWVQCQKRHQIPVNGRIVVARIWPTEDLWPEILLDERGEPLVGFTFYDLTQADARPQPYEWPDPTGAKGPFRDALLDMVGRIWKKLSSVQDHLEERRRREEEAARMAGKAVIYLHARVAHAEAWGRACEALDRYFVIMPGEPDPVERDPKLARHITERRIEALTGCDGLLLLGSDDGRALDADLVVVGRQDRQSARARAERLLPCGVLDTAGIDWIDMTLDFWPDEVRNRMTRAGPWWAAPDECGVHTR